MRPVSSVARRLSSFPHATVRTSFVSASWATMGNRPSRSAISFPPDRDPATREVPLDVGDRHRALVEDPREEGRVREASREDLRRVPGPPETPGGNHGPPDEGADRAIELEVVPLPGPVAVHARDEELPRAEGLGLRGPREGVEVRLLATAVRVDAPGAAVPLRVDREDDALGSEGVRGLPDDLGPLDRSRVHADLVRAGPEEARDVRGRPDAAPDRKGDRQARGRVPDDVDKGLASLRARGDVAEDDLVGPLVLVRGRGLDGIPDDAEVPEADALHDPTRVDVEAGDDPRGRAQGDSSHSTFPFREKPRLEGTRAR